MIRHALVTVAAASAFALSAAAPALAAQSYPINFKNLALGASDSTRSGTVLSGGSLVLAPTGLSGPFDYVDPFANYSGDGADGSGAYDYGTWTSGVTTPTFTFNELVASWNASTPAGTWVQVEMRPRLEDGHWAKWYILGRWASGDSDFHRTSVGGQGDADGFVAVDTFFAKDHPAVAYQLRLSLYRRAGTTATPSVSRLSAVASNLTNQKGSFPSATTMNGTTIDLDVPLYSQEIHHGEYPQFDNGGEAWCSPTSTSMVVGYWDKLFPDAGYAPSEDETSWVGFPDPWVDFTARYVYDYRYNGAGNWPFNTAYAAARGLVADVTQLHNLREAEPFVKAGIPLVASVAWSSNKLAGGIKSTNGHLSVIVGFTGDGQQVIVNDPASDTNAQVKHYYDREEYERAWIPASGGIVYVIRPAGWHTPSLTANNS
jgi:peptidase C39-like protein